MKLIYVTNRHALKNEERFFETVQRNLSLSLFGIYLREKDLPEADFIELAQRVVPQCQNANVQLILPGHYKIFDLFPGAWIQAGAGTPGKSAILQKHAQSRNIIFSCHSLSEAKRAEREGATALFFSPIFATTCKPKQMAQGLENLKAVCQAVRLPVFALGGVSMANRNDLAKAGAKGLAGISMFQDKFEENRLAFHERIA